MTGILLTVAACFDQINNINAMLSLNACPSMHICGIVAQWLCEPGALVNQRDGGNTQTCGFF